DTMNGCNVGVIQGGQHAGFTVKSRYAVRISGKGFGKELNGDTSTQLRVGGLIDVAQTTAAKVGGNREVCEFGSDHDLIKICGRILSNNPQVIYAFEACAGTSGEEGLSWRSSSPGELHPEALTEPCLSLSAHTALAIQESWRSLRNDRAVPPVAS